MSLEKLTIAQLPKQMCWLPYSQQPNTIFYVERDNFRWHIPFYINKIPTRCNSMQSDLFYCKVTLHVSGVHGTHHQEY